MNTNVASLCNTKTETFFERHAWKIMLVVILFIGIFGVSDIVGGALDLQNGETVFMHSITGKSWNELRSASPRVANLIDLKFRTDGAAIATIALLSMTVCFISFRKGERWAWFALSLPTLWMLSTVFFLLMADKLPGYGTPVPIISGSILSAIWISILVLSQVLPIITRVNQWYMVPMITLKSGYTEPKLPWPLVRASTTDDELKAMYAYLHGLAVVEGPAK
jgi:hypothetical protein